MWVAHTTVSTASGTCQTVMDRQVPDAVDTVVCAPDDGWRYHPKHVEQFPEINQLCNVHLVGYISEDIHILFNTYMSQTIYT